MKAGAQNISWDGCNDQGRRVPSGVYIYTLEAQTHDGRKERYDPADETGGLLLKVRKPLADSQNRQITYIMPRAGQVRIRAGIKNGPHLRTLIDWEPREAGRQAEAWDGLDQSGLINLFNIKERQVHIFAYTIPNNSIIVKRASQTASEVFAAASEPERRPRTQVNPDRKYEHALHNLADCHEPDFTVIFPGAETEDGLPVLSGVAPIKIVIAEKDRFQLESARFEVMLYADLRFIFEDEEGFTPFTFLWDTKGMTAGEHILTVNILGYNDHCGVRSHRVLIKKP